MQAKFKISMNNPCSEKWDNMSPDGNGRFCDSCQQSVIDFTDFADDDLKDWFIENEGKSCGKFKPEQLDHLILIKSKYSLNKFKPSLIAASFAAILSLPKLSNAQIQKPNTIQTDYLQKQNDKPDEVLPDSTNLIKGRVLDKDDKSTIPGVSIMVGNTLIRTSTNDKGDFELRLPKNLEDNKIDITVTYIGYKALTSRVNLLKTKELTIELCPSNEVLGGAEFYYIRNPSIWDRLRQLFGKK